MVCISQGKRLLEKAVEEGLANDPDIQNQLVQMFCVCGSLEEARSLFDTTPSPHLTSWNMLIAAYGNAGRTHEAVRLFERMPSKSDASFTTMVLAFAKSGQKAEARSMFDSIKQPNTIAWNSMISLYAHNGQLEEAKSMFKRMPKPNVVTHNAMITGYGYDGRVAEAKSLFDRMIKRTTISWNAMVTAFAQNARVDEAKALFDEMPEKSVISWNTMIAGYGQNGRPREALELFKNMDLEGTQPSKLTYCSVLDACASLTASSEGKLIHAGIDEALLGDIQIGNSVCNMYGKCGLPESARQTFLKMTYHDVVSWTGIIAAYAQNGFSPEALEVFRIMLQVGQEPNEITLINTLSACSHGGLYQDGCDIFSSMTRADYKIATNESHFGCMIDLLGRAGYLEAAEELIKKMPYAAGAVAWTSLLSACRTYRDMKRASRVAKSLFDLDAKPTKDPSPYVMLSNIYASAGKSAISIRGQKNDFYSLDETHPRRDEAYSELRRLLQEMEEAGYVPETKKAEMEEEETEQSLSYHSEKLAVAYGVGNTPAEAPLCIVKNLRVCSDCHNFIKFLSKFLSVVRYNESLSSQAFMSVSC